MIKSRIWDWNPLDRSTSYHFAASGDGDRQSDSWEPSCTVLQKVSTPEPHSWPTQASRCARVPNWAERWIPESDFSQFQLCQSWKTTDSPSWGVLSPDRQSDKFWHSIWILEHPYYLFVAHLTLTVSKFSPAGALCLLSSLGDEF